jgi:hypothetical protein
LTLLTFMILPISSKIKKGKSKGAYKEDGISTGFHFLAKIQTELAKTHKLCKYADGIIIMHQSQLSFPQSHG